MKKLTKIITAVLLLTSLAFAAELMSLKANMKQTNTLLKSITASVKDTSKNAENAANTQKMIEYFTAARNQTPGVGSLAEYQNLMDQNIALFKELQLAFTVNDNVLAEATLQKISVIKKEGHDKFN